MWRRSPAVAGSFYPSNPQKLSHDINSYLKNAKKELKPLSGGIFGLIVPHAGYVYSGTVAAYSYALLAGSGIELAVVIAPSHRARFQGASIIPSGIYETPLGDVAIDSEMGEALEKLPHLKFIKDVHADEHSLEVQVPFLQVTLGNFKLVPLIVGAADIDTCRTIASEIAQVLSKEKRRFVVVISTDLSHYYPYESACRIDGVFMDLLRKRDIDALYGCLCDEKAQACGQGPVLIGLTLAELMGARSVEILKYANSGDTAGGKDRVVGYLAAALLKQS